MAEAAVGNNDSDIENTVNCPICFEYMLDSRTLYPCIHTFCEKCVSRLDRKRKEGKTGVDCPMCRGFVAESEIRKNRLMNVLINLVTKEEDSGHEKQCGQCGNTKVVSKCLQCNIELCKNCNDRHQNIPACNDHQLVLLSDISCLIVKNVIEFCPKHPKEQIRMNCVPCNVAICSLCKFQEHDLHKSETIEAALQRYRPLIRAALDNIRQKSGTGKQGVHHMKQQVKAIEENKKNLTQELQAQKKKLLTKINSDYEKLQQEVNDYSAAKIKELSLRIEETEHFVSSDESVVTYTETIVANTDGGGLLMELQTGLMERIEQLQCSYVRSDQVGVSEQLVFKPSEVMRVDRNSVGKLEIKEDSKLQHSPQSSQPKARVIVRTGRKGARLAIVTRILDFPINSTIQMIKKASFCVERTALRMCAFQDSLLMPCNNTLEWYTLQGQLQKTVTIKDYEITSVCPLPTGDVVLATKTGLYQVDITGNVISQLHGGWFRDVHVGEEHIAAIDELDTVYLWSRKDLLTLKFRFDCKHRINNVIIKENCLYLSSLDNSSIYIYDLQGKLLQSSGVFGVGGGAGELCAVRLCAVDCEDNLLVADGANHRLQLLSTRTGRWSLLPDELNVYLPVDALIVGDTLYVLTTHDNTVFMFRYK